MNWHVQEADQGIERIGAAVLSGPMESFEALEEPEEAASAKLIAKELFPTGDSLPRSGIIS